MFERDHMSLWRSPPLVLVRGARGFGLASWLLGFRGRAFDAKQRGSAVAR